MDNKPKRINRNDRLKDKDRGDRNSLNEDDTKKLPPAPDRGDLSKIVNLKKILQNKTENTEQISQSTNTEEVRTKRKVEKAKNVEFRQRVRERYTLKPKGILKFQRRNEEQFCLVQDDLSSKEYFCKEASELKTTPDTKSERSTKQRTPARRKPVEKHAIRVPKVTFVEKKARPLEIRAPEPAKQLITPRGIMKRVYVTSKTPEKCVKRSKIKENRVPSAPSPGISQATIVSPPTEVAQWTSATTKHTMPYYEAWVDTTLAAISKLSKKEKAYLSKQKVMQSFQSELRRTWSPELLYRNIKDERYTGKIRVRQK